MNDGANLSIWMLGDRPEYPSLTEDVEADVCVIGGGIAGLTTAYLLAREGQHVVLLEDGRVGGRMTDRTTAHLSFALDDRYFEIERLHGARGARLAAESHSKAVDTIELIASREGIACDFERVDGFLFVPPGESRGVLERELEAAHRVGLSDVRLVERAPLTSFDTGPCLRFPNQGQFHPSKYMLGIARATTEGGTRIFEQTHVEAIEPGDTCTVKTRGGSKVRAKHVVVATNVPISDRFAIHTKQAPYTSYVVAARIPAGDVPRALYWDTLDPYHYVRTQDDLLIVGGEDRKSGTEEDPARRYAELEAWMRERFPSAGEVSYRWSGQVMEPHDGMAFIGHDPGSAPNIWVATGDSGHGITHGTIAGLLLTDKILGRENAWSKLYDPKRKTLRSLPTFVKENAEVAAEMTKWARGGDVKSVDEIAPGQGAIVRNGLALHAVYRDESGALLERNAACPHLGCVVAWNRDERTWDCPCHGSRFDCRGKVLGGPSKSDLAPVTRKSE